MTRCIWLLKNVKLLIQVQNRIEKSIFANFLYFEPITYKLFNNKDLGN